ncbi:MAG: hypothetical protein AVO35_12030 [Candidatus Aegiribacteria sp. MLS_C]|nr:MAG: hypothetical protein AVO35_12030 [Candidatus Aegiribacteria sp. MLS_C]
MGLFGRRKKTVSTAPEEWREIRWEISSPLMVQFSDGIGSIRAFGRFSCEIADAALLAENGCDAHSSDSLKQFSNYLRDLVVRSFKNELGAVSGSMTGNTLLGNSELLSRAAMDGASPVLAQKGVSLAGLTVDELLKA